MQPGTVSAAEAEQTGRTVIEGDVCSVEDVEKVDGDAVSADVVEDALWRVSGEDTEKQTYCNVAVVRKLGAAVDCPVFCVQMHCERRWPVVHDRYKS